VETFNSSFLNRRFSTVNDNESRRHQMFRRVRDFGTAHASDFATTSLAQQQFTSLTAVINELDGHASSESSGYGDERQGTSARAQARDAVRDDLEAINRTAKAMAGDVPAVDDKFRVPRNNNDQQLLNAARAFKDDATPLQAQFVAHEMPADFLTELQNDIDALEDAITAQSSGVGSHVSAGAAIDDAISRGVEVVRKLDAIVRNKYANNPAVLAEWTSASHTERAPRRGAPVTAPPPPPPAPTPTA
jgi:hypothetical protein